MQRRLRTTLSVAMAIALAPLGIGCDQWGVSESERLLQQELDQARIDLRRCQDTIAERDARIDTLQRHFDRNRPFKDVDLDDLFVVDSIQIVSRSGGADLDRQTGDDGVVVYVRTLDAEGDVIKAAGEFVVQLFDLTEPGQPRELALCNYDDRETLRKSWYGGFLTNHFTLECPFQPGQMPSTREVHVRVTFLDWLTGRSFSHSMTVAVRRITSPAAPATQPARSTD